MREQSCQSPQPRLSLTTPGLHDIVLPRNFHENLEVIETHGQAIETISNIIISLNRSNSSVIKDMKSDIHPDVDPVVFVDTSCGAEFITRSTLSSKETRDIGGVSHFVINIEISSASHPFFTGEERFVDTTGRVDKFKEKMDRVEAAAKERKGKKAKRDAKVALKKEAEKKAKPAKKEKPAVEAPVETPVVEEAPTLEAPADDATEK